MSVSDAERVLREVVEWYAEKARALHRYGQEPVKAEAMEAVVTELMLDNGTRAAEALSRHMPTQPTTGLNPDGISGLAFEIANEDDPAKIGEALSRAMIDMGDSRLIDLRRIVDEAAADGFTGEWQDVICNALADLNENPIHLPTQPCVDVEALVKDIVREFERAIETGTGKLGAVIRSHVTDAATVRADRDMVWCDAFGGSSSDPQQVAAIQKERRALVRAEALEQAAKLVESHEYVDGPLMDETAAKIRALAPKERSDG